MRPRLVWLLLLLLCAAGGAQASMCRLYLASQYDWAGATGFYLDLEGETLTDLRIYLGVGNGAGWRFPTWTPGFVFGRDYHLRAAVAPDRAQLCVDDVLVAESPGTWQPAPGDLVVGERPAWASDPGDWIGIVSEATIVLTRGGVEVERHAFPFPPETRPVPVQLFEPAAPQTSALEAQTGDTVAADVTLHFGEADLAAWAPFIDPYGQCRYATWPEKVGSDAELQDDIATEDLRLLEFAAPADFDQYGGYLSSGWREEPTGFFRVVKKEGYWWLITPEGNPCFYLGVSVAPASTWPMTPTTGREWLFEWLPPHEAPWLGVWGRDVWAAGPPADYVAFQGANLIRKYGDSWQTDAEARCIRRLRAFGFGGGGKWGAPAGLVQSPVLYYGNTPMLVSHLDVFDPSVRAAAAEALGGEIGPWVDSPLILGWSVGSEREALIGTDEIVAIMHLAETVPGKRALLDYAVDSRYGGSVTALAAAWGLAVTTRAELYAATPTPPAADVEAMRLYYADRYYAFNYETTKSLDPNHLYLGSYGCAGCADIEEDLRRLGSHCDVMSWDIYAPGYGNERFARLSAEADRPVFIGEFSYPPFYEGTRGFGRYGVYTRDDAEAGDRYRAWVEAATSDPRCVGGEWFEYRDQPLTGRGPGSGPRLVWDEHYAFGLVTQTDRVKWDLVARMRTANTLAPRWRFAAAGRPFPDVPADSWAVGEIAACKGAGVVGGYGDGTYRPMVVVTREQMAGYIARALAGGDAHVPTGPPVATFPDVEAGAWAYRYVEYCAAQRVVGGYPDGRYWPLAEVDRAQMAVFVARAMAPLEERPGLPSYVAPTVPSFPDVLDSGNTAWAYREVEYAREHGVVGGYPDGRYHPEVPVTREQMAAFIARAFGL